VLNKNTQILSEIYTVIPCSSCSNRTEMSLYPSSLNNGQSFFKQSIEPVVAQVLRHPIVSHLGLKFVTILYLKSVSFPFLFRTHEITTTLDSDRLCRSMPSSVWSLQPPYSELSTFGVSVGPNGYCLSEIFRIERSSV
jgi:hypothetical protein